MEKRVFTVLRGGGEYGPQHVQAMQRQVRKWAPADTQFYCLSDTDVPGVDCIPLENEWPGWWSKLELFRAVLKDDFVYTDLDNVLLGPIDFAFEATEFTADIGFSFFRVTPDVHRPTVYRQFADDAAWHMEEWAITRTDGKFGDAAFLRHRMGLNPVGWNPQWVMNVVDMPFDGGRLSCPWRATPRHIPDGVRVMLCGGKRRRPWLSLSNQVQRSYWCREKV